MQLVTFYVTLHVFENKYLGKLKTKVYQCLKQFLKKSH